MRSILLLPLVARCLESIDVCIWRMFVFMSVCNDCVGVCGNVLLCSIRCKDSVLALKYVVCLCKECDGCCFFCLYCDAWICRCSCMGSMSDSSCNCSTFLSCVHPVAVINAA